MRTDDDSWDITTSVGSTALFVAAARAVEAQKPNPAAVDPYAEVFCRAVGGPWAAVLDGTVPNHKLAGDFGVHFVNFQGVRTRYFDSFFADAAAGGVRQVVIFAAGLDSRAYRLDWPADTVIYELDRPQILDFKRTVLEERGETPMAARVEIPVDLRDDWPRALREAGFDHTAPAAFIAEGLLIYLPAAAQDSLFRGIDALAAPGSFVGVEEGEPMPAEAFEAAKAAESAADEENSFFTLVYNEQFARADDWFGARGWDTVTTPLLQYLGELGRVVPDTGTQADAMIRANTLVSGVKR
ncbi:class I SAM-dependent methyltransferase [Mycolicibacterium sp.]|uniref:class I SAM-dependent methyltransferase n=1 Tax=Mycolicibacterium sp. TaxID=2320850 RepID=UPI00355E863A